MNPTNYFIILFTTNHIRGGPGVSINMNPINNWQSPATSITLILHHAPPEEYATYLKTLCNGLSLAHAPHGL